MVTMQIWTNRLLKELDGISSRLPRGVTLSSHDMEPETGVCKAYFEASLAPAAASAAANGSEKGGHEAQRRGEGEKDSDDAPSKSSTAAVPAEGKIDGESLPLPSNDVSGEEDGERKRDEGQDGAEGSSMPQIDEATAAPDLLHFKIEMDLGLATRYPFDCPVIRILEGDDVIPTSILSGDLLSLPGSDTWTPSSTIVNTLQDVVDMVVHAKEAGIPTGQGGDDAAALERGELRPGSLVPTEALFGCLFPCSPPPSPLFSGSSLDAVLGSSSRRPLDRYVGLTDRQLLELEAHRTQMNKAVVVSAIPLSSLKKLKFRRGASVTVILKNDDAKEFLTPQSYECVKAVTQRLEKMGIAGHQTTVGAERQVDRASSLMAALTRKEAMFGIREHPDLPLVEECMDLFRQAAELYSAADDPRHEEVLAHMHRFLQRPDVLSALSGDTIVSSGGGGGDGAPTPVDADDSHPGGGGSETSPAREGGTAATAATADGSGGPSAEAVAADSAEEGSPPDVPQGATAGTSAQSARALPSEDPSSPSSVPEDGKPESAAAAAAVTTPVKGTAAAGGSSRVGGGGGSSSSSSSSSRTRTPSKTAGKTVTAGRAGGAAREGISAGGGRTGGAAAAGAAAAAGGGVGGRPSPSAGKTAGVSSSVSSVSSVRGKASPRGKSTTAASTARSPLGARKDAAAAAAAAAVAAAAGAASPRAKKSASSTPPVEAGASRGRGKTRGGSIRGGRGGRGRGAGTGTGTAARSAGTS